MNINEARLVDGIVNHNAHIRKAIAYIKENYGIDGECISEGVIKLTCNNVNNALMLAQAKQHIEEEMGDMIQVVF